MWRCLYGLSRQFSTVLDASVSRQRENLEALQIKYATLPLIVSFTPTGFKSSITDRSPHKCKFHLVPSKFLRRLQLLPSNDQFRVKFTYSNLIYGLVTYLAEVIGGDTWENLLTSHLLKPIGMDQTTFLTTADMSTIPDLATGYISFGDKLSPVNPEFSRLVNKSQPSRVNR